MWMATFFFFFLIIFYDLSGFRLCVDAIFPHCHAWCNSKRVDQGAPYSSYFSKTSRRYHFIIIQLWSHNNFHNNCQSAKLLMVNNKIILISSVHIWELIKTCQLNCYENIIKDYVFTLTNFYFLFFFLKNYSY